MKQPSRAMTWVTTLCPLSDPEPASHLVAFLIGLQATSVTSQPQAAWVQAKLEPTEDWDW